MSAQYDALIVGGGPAGATCAWLLRNAGMQVAIIDKQQFPRDKICAGWITPAVVETLQIDLQDYARGRVLQPLTGFITAMIGEKIRLTQYGKPMSYGIRRCEFDHYLLQRSGAAMHLGEPVKSLAYENGLWLVNQKYQAPLLIGAGGHFCPVVRLTGARQTNSEPIVAAQEVEFEMTPEHKAHCLVDPQAPELYFCRDLKGYGWVFRKGDYLNIGLGRQDNHRLSAHVNEFVDYLQQAGRIPPALPKKMSGHAYLLYGDTPRKIVDDGLLIIGDAAGLAYAQSGEGIRPAIESAVLAAQTILQHARTGSDYSRQALSEYETLLSRRFGDRHKRTNIKIAALVPQGIKRSLAARLLASKYFSRNFVLNKWFFHLQQPPLDSGFGTHGIPHGA